MAKVTKQLLGIPDLKPLKTRLKDGNQMVVDYSDVIGAIVRSSGQNHAAIDEACTRQKKFLEYIEGYEKEAAHLRAKLKIWSSPSMKLVIKAAGLSREVEKVEEYAEGLEKNAKGFRTWIDNLNQTIVGKIGRWKIVKK